MNESQIINLLIDLMREYYNDLPLRHEMCVEGFLRFLEEKASKECNICHCQKEDE
ncbi:MAG: hypothetical protein HOG49_39675 [Candidatus Scalindua sp.]|jgi:hypothetical protein|nr:hypothetical protein [Candidatus Scalindua sp.]